ncbi:MAG: archaellin/type IV pilin N-terminal domain-containing protein [Dehalococcoidia bacterium]|jgi:flagellin FlaB
MSRLLKLIKRVSREEEGITGLETAIILIAFVVVATVFAFVVLSTGLFSSERGKEAVYAGLQKTEGSLELRGSVIANTSGTQVTSLVFDLANAAGGEPVDLDPNATSNKMVVDYRDSATSVANIAWTVNWLVGNGDNLLSEGELAEINVDLSGQSLGPNQAFTVEVKPPLGGTMVIARTTPAGLDAVVDLH